jgi:hypothetical protein
LCTDVLKQPIGPIINNQEEGGGGEVAAAAAVVVVVRNIQYCIYKSPLLFRNSVSRM